MVMSAVSSVSTPGVLVTVMPRWRAVSRSIWSTPGAERGDQLQARSGLRQHAAVDAVGHGGHQHVGRFTASTSWAELSGLSSALSRVSNSSISRVSIASGSFRVTITSGFFLELVGM
jgi:hypothetical protein